MIFKKKRKKGLSIIVPIYNNYEDLIKIIDSIQNQSLKPNELIIIDSSNNKQTFNNKILHIDDIKIIYKKVNKAFPGEARNYGAIISNYLTLGFLDSKTIPNNDWIEKQYFKINNEKYDVVFGKTLYLFNTFFQKITNFATFGNKPVITTPGSLISANVFFNNNLFIEKVRTGDDLEWRERLIYKKYKIYYPKNSNVNYFSYPLNLYDLLKKYFVYSIYTSFINIQNDLKDTYLILFIFLSSLVIPRWNYLVGWEDSLFYFPHITKIYTIIILLFLFTLIVIKRIYRRNIFLIKIFYLTSVIFIGGFFIKYYDTFGNFIFYQSLSFENITINFILLCMLFSFLYRGLYSPLTKNIHFTDILPFKWIYVGFLGLLLDLVKIPGYTFGSLISIIRSFTYYRNHNTQQEIRQNISLENNILFLCPFPYNLQAGQRLKFEQYYDYFLKNNFSIYHESFYDESDYKYLYIKGYYLRKLFIVIKGYIKRLYVLININKYEIIYIHMWVSPFFGSFYEKLYKFFGKKIILDLEDNVFLISKNNVNPISFYFKSFEKLKYLIKNSDHIITSSPYLISDFKKITKKNNITFISSSINTSRYTPLKTHKNTKPITIGWTGTVTTSKYIKIVEPVLKRIQKIRDIKFLVIGNFKYENLDLNVESIDWNLNSEIKDLSKIDIGLYPIHDDYWSLGKSGLKALQYMALGIPPVCSNVGTNKDIIKNEINGFLANNEEEWFNHIISLIDNEKLRSTIGKNAKNTIDKYYSTNEIGSQYLNLINRVIYD